MTWAVKCASPRGPAPVVAPASISACGRTWWAFCGPGGIAPPTAQCGPTTVLARVDCSASISSAWAVLLARPTEATHVACRTPGRAVACAYSSFRWAPTSSSAALMSMLSSVRSTSTTVDGGRAGSSVARRVLNTCGSEIGSDQAFPRAWRRRGRGGR